MLILDHPKALSVVLNPNFTLESPRNFTLENILGLLPVLIPEISSWMTQASGYIRRLLGDYQGWKPGLQA